nr:MAG TPA: hypothetical protein [Caudoviricetes sp.]
MKNDVTINVKPVRQPTREKSSGRPAGFLNM